MPAVVRGDRCVHAVVICNCMLPERKLLCQNARRLIYACALALPDQATAGDTHLGGEDFDNRLTAHCIAVRSS